MINIDKVKSIVDAQEQKTISETIEVEEALRKAKYLLQNTSPDKYYIKELTTESYNTLKEVITPLIFESTTIIIEHHLRKKGHVGDNIVYVISKDEHGFWHGYSEGNKTKRKLVNTSSVVSMLSFLMSQWIDGGPLVVSSVANVIFM